MAKKLKEKGLVAIKVYLNQEEFTSISKQAEKAGYRQVGLPLRTQRPHGFAGEKLANTDGISPYLKFCAQYHQEWEAWRLEEGAQLTRQIELLQTRKAKLKL